MFNDHKSLYDDLAYIKSKMSLPYVTEVILNTFGYDTINKITHVNCDNTISGYANLRFNNLNDGDIIEAYADFYSVSGVLPKIFYDELLPTINVDHAQLQQSGKWETLKLTSLFLNKSGGDMRFVFGLGVGDMGEFKMKNVRGEVKRNTTIINQKRIEPFVAIKEINNEFILRSNFIGNEGVISSLGFGLRITFNRPFPTSVPVGSINSNGSNNGYLYTPVITSMTNNSVDIRFVDNTTITFLSDVTTLPDNYSFYAVVTGEY